MKEEIGILRLKPRFMRTYAARRRRAGEGRTLSVRGYWGLDGGGVAGFGEGAGLFVGEAVTLFAGCAWS